MENQTTNINDLVRGNGQYRVKKINSWLIRILKIYVAGHKGLVGSAILRRLRKKGYKKIIYIDRKRLDLTNQKKVINFFKKKKIDFIFIAAAAKVGGVYSNNKYKAEFIYENLSIQNNLIHNAYLAGIKNLNISWIKLRLSKRLQTTN